MPLTNQGNTYKKLLIPLSFIVMMLVAYVIDPLSFQEVWKGRAFYLFFLWLFALEFIIGSQSPASKANLGADWARIVGGFFMLMIPTIYIVESYMFGLNSTIIGFGKFLGVGQGLSLSDQTYFINSSFPLSVEYLVTATSIFIGIFLLLDFEGTKQFSISVSLLAMMGIFYMVDTFRPYATASFPNFWSLLSPLFPNSQTSIQGFVPFLSSIVAVVMQKMGYVVQMVVLKQDGAVQMVVNNTGFTIYWPCAGIHSLFIYTFVILLFLKGSPMSLGKKVGCLVIGAVGTFFVNVLRIVSIISIYIGQGADAGNYFHNYYGELFFLTWIVIYLFALVSVQRFMIRKTPNT